MRQRNAEYVKASLFTNKLKAILLQIVVNQQKNFWQNSFANQCYLEKVLLYIKLYWLISRGISAIISYKIRLSKIFFFLSNLVSEIIINVFELI